MASQSPRLSLRQSPPMGQGIARVAGSGTLWNAELVIARLEEAGRTLLALPNTGYTTHLKQSVIEVIRSAIEGDCMTNVGGRLRPAVPPSACITRMDEALGWIPLIPLDRYVLRRIVGARALINPLTDRYLYPWRKVGIIVGADHKAVQRWHAQGIDLIVAALNKSGTCRP
jgi:hypothetical protein